MNAETGHFRLANSVDNGVSIPSGWQLGGWNLGRHWGTNRGFSGVLLMGLLCSSVGAFGADGGASEPASGPSTFLQNGVTAHRGNSGEFPENTLPAFESALELGVDWIELDLYRTKDGQLVLIHDTSTGRVGDRDLKVMASTYKELMKIDVATDFRQRLKLSPEACPPARIPLLAEVLKLIMRQDRTRVSLQPKMDCVAEAVSLVQERGAERWVGFNDGNLELMSKAKQLAPSIPIFWDRPAEFPLEEDLRVAKTHGFEAIVLQHRGVTAETVQAIKKAGFEVGAWTVNDPADMQRLLDLGVQRLYTDFPRKQLALRQTTSWQTVRCEGTYPHHLQGICVDGEALYWSFTTQLVKTDLAGRRIHQVPVANHHGDLCIHAGKLYVAVNLGKFNHPEGHADSWIYVYEAQTLKELARHPVPEVFYGAGGIGVHQDQFFVVGGLPASETQNPVYQYDAEFQFVKKHAIASGQTKLGIQTATFAQNRWWFGCYGSPPILLVTDANFQMIGRYEFNASLGIAALPDGRILTATGLCDQQTGCTGRAHLSSIDERTGLKR